MIKKVLLVTLFDERNIGNRLQNYALQKVIERYGIEVTTIDNYYTQNLSIMSIVKNYIRKLLGHLGYKKYKKAQTNYTYMNKLRKTIKKFNKENISKIKQMSNQQVFDTDWSYYDLAVAGSDQIWHKWRKDVNELPFYYLQFVPFEKRVSYAASFGFEEFPGQDIEQHRVGLSEMKKISCREQTGCDLVKSLVGKDVTRVLDPTLLLNADEWRAIEKKAVSPSKVKERYAFSFFLGEISDEYKQFIDSIMKKNEISKLIDAKSKYIKEFGPCEFLNLIDQAQYVFTDSFHCTVFCVIFNKEFTVFRRIQVGFEKMFGRIEDLLSSTNKLEHIYGGTLHKATNNFDQLYLDSIQYIEDILEI